MQIINFLYPEKSEIKYRIDTYPDSQSHLVLESEMDRRKSLLIYTRLSNLNDIWILMQLADICHRQGIQISYLQIAYLFAARTDRLFSFNEALDLELVKKCLIFVQAQQILVLDPHSKRLITEGVIDNDWPAFFALKPGSNIPENGLFPDEGAYHRYSELFDFDTTYYATKHRISRDKLEVKLPSRIKPNTSILVFDDLCDGGGTFFAIYKALQDMGVTDVHLRVTHAIQKEPLVKLSKLYKTITITNSYKDWDKEELPNNIKVIKVYE
jgi:ribose-phosphate pyrophosphokinase